MPFMRNFHTEYDFTIFPAAGKIIAHMFFILEFKGSPIININIYKRGTYPLYLY